MSDDDLDLNEEEFLMSTRQRRSNAGNKMKKLLEQELEDMQSKTDQLEEDEMDLLFMEEGDDEDFESEASGDNENEFKHNLEEETGGDEADEMFSESEEEPGDQDEDNEEGEKSIRRQEKLESQKRKRRTPAVIKRKRPKIDTQDVAAKQEQEAKKKAQYEQIKAESLLITNRRTSQRSSVVANKYKVYEKLSKAEKKRKMIQDRIRKQKESQKEEILTQEDRIRIALETEKFNILSLDKYKEQEISKKQSRIALQQRQKMKFKPGETVLRHLSCSWKVTPATEIEDTKHWEEQLKKREKKKRRYTRKPSKKQNSDSKKENNVKVEENLNEGGVLKNTNDTAGQPLIADTTTLQPGTNENISIQNSRGTPPTKPVQDTKAGANEVEENNSELMSNENDNVEQESTEGFPPHFNKHNSENYSSEQRTSDNQSVSDDRFPFKAEDNTGTMENNKISKPTIDETKEITSRPSINERESPFEKGNSNSPMIPKQVTFVDAPQVNLIDSDDKPLSMSPSSASFPSDITNDKSTPELIEDAESEEELIFEGPEQLVGKNFITLYSFPTESYHKDINKELFGDSWTSGSSHRPSDVETLCKLTVPEGKIDILEDASLTPDLSFLNDFPAFGEYDKKVIHDVDSTANKELEIEVKTAPPTGVFLPNGFRKKCLISSKECQYFDPKNGVPYSDVETYKTIQDLQDPIGTGTEENPGPHYQWFGFRNGGVYLDVGQKPAKDVPDGF